MVCIFIGPMFGFISDKIGHRVTFSLISTTTVTLCLFMFILIPFSTPDHRSYLGLIPLFLMKVSSSILISVFYPILSFLVPPYASGSAYSVFSSALNITYAFGPFLIALFNTPALKEDTYYYVCLTLGLFSLINIPLCFMLRSLTKGRLQHPSKAKP